MLHLYALTGAEPPADPIRGVDDTVVNLVRSGPFHAVVSEHERSPRAAPEAALAHANVVGRLLSLVPTLPVRFGSAHADLAGLHRSLASAKDELEEALARVGGHVEFAARLRTESDGPNDDTVEPMSPERGGRAYLERRLASRRAHEASRAEMQRRLAESTVTLDALAHSVRMVSSRRGPERCFLVALDQVPEIERAAAGLSSDSTVEVAGPFPPFSFAGGQAS